MQKEQLEKMISGHWLQEPSQEWEFCYFATTKNTCHGEKTLFIAMDEDCFLKGSGNTGIYAGWADSHRTLAELAKAGLIGGAVVQKPVSNLPDGFPLYQTENPYALIVSMAEYGREHYTGKVLSITGTVGKTTTKELLLHCLSQKGETLGTPENYNSRTGNWLLMANAVSQPDYLVLETAMSALWMRDRSINTYTKPHLAVITQVGMGQNRTEAEAVWAKARVANGLVKDGIVVINRDIHLFEQTVEEVRKYAETATILTYGFHEKAEVRIFPTETGGYRILWPHGSLTLQTADFDKGFLSNCAACVCVLYALGMDPAEFQDILQKNFGQRSAMIERVPLVWSQKKALLLDDSYNAEELSIRNALEYFSQKKEAFTGKKILIIGRIVNLEKLDKNIHERLAEPILQSGADMVFAFGEECTAFMEKLPKEMQGGVFTDARLCASAVYQAADEDAFILLKGSRRNSSLPKIREYLEHTPEESLNSAKLRPYTDSPYLTAMIEGETGEILAINGNMQHKTPLGLGHCAFILEALQGIMAGGMKSDTIYTVGKGPAREEKAARAIGLKEGEAVTLHTLLLGAVSLNAPDALIALAETVGGSNSEAVKKVLPLGKKWNIENTALGNLTGRRMSKKEQSYTITSLQKIAKSLCALPPQGKSYLIPTELVYQNALFSPKTALHLHGIIWGGLFWGSSDGEGIAIFQRENKWFAVAVMGAKDAFQRDYLMAQQIYQYFAKDTADKPVPIPLPHGKLTMIGDTYFGEDYTAKRQKRGIEDALSRFGYGHSFAQLAPFFTEDSFNMVNFEAVCTPKGASSSLAGIKPFLLDTRGKETLDELKKRRIRGVFLANNHTMDFGDTALLETVTLLQENGFAAIGAGQCAKEAAQPLVFDCEDKKCFVFNAYWYVRKANTLFSTYALGEKAGANCTDGTFTAEIARCRKENPDAWILAVVHWGRDFEEILQGQRKRAEAIVKAGVDCIIGHGAHMIQGIHRIDGVPVVYSIGNGVFNSNGEYLRRGMPPYGFLTEISLKKRKIKLYPIYLLNTETFWQPRPVTSLEAEDVWKWLEKWDSSLNGCELEWDEEKTSFYISLDF